MENNTTQIVDEMVERAIEIVGEPRKTKEFRRYSPEFFQAIEKMWSMGYNCTQIGKGLGIKRHSVGSYLKLKGLYKPQQYQTKNREKLALAREVNPY